MSPAELFTEYPYFSSYADTWVAHAARLRRDGDRPLRPRSELARRRGGEQRRVLARARGRGRRPGTGNRARGQCCCGGRREGHPDGRRVLRARHRSRARCRSRSGRSPHRQQRPRPHAAAPRLHRRARNFLSDTGVLTLEFPHLLRLIGENQFDTIYHEHFSYFSFFTAERAFREHGITLFDVEEHPTHGGSLRIFGRHEADATKPVSSRIDDLRARELAAGVADLAMYAGFPEQVKAMQRALVEFLTARRTRESASLRTARPARATRCSTPAASGLTSSTSSSTGVPTSRDCSRPARICRSARPTHSATRARTWCSSSRGTCPGDHAPGGLHSGVGRAVRPPDTVGADRRTRLRCEQRGVMKVVLFCGGFGSRLREHAGTIPKPLVTIGSRPILWHLMRYSRITATASSSSASAIRPT